MLRQLVYIISTLTNLITYLIQQGKTNNLKKKYEEVNSNTPSAWASGFGVRLSDENPPTKASFVK